MKCLKVEEYIKQTGSAEETRRLTQELQVRERDSAHRSRAHTEDLDLYF